MRRFDTPTVLLTVLLTAIGLLAVYSAGGARHLLRQLLFLPVAVGALTAMLFIPRRIIYGLTEFSYAIALLSLIAVKIVGTGPGSHRWFEIGSVSFQPSEFAKLATVLMLGKRMSTKRTIGLSPRDVSLPVLIVALPAMLIAIEPDLSTAVIFAALLAVVLYWQGMRPLHILLLYSPVLSFVAGVSLWTWIPFFVLLAILVVVRSTLLRAFLALVLNAFFGLLSPLLFSALRVYQQTRIRSFLAPWLDPHGISWNAVQSQIAIGSGRLLGKGYLRGSQNRLGFLPNRHTDFVFSVVAEEFGFVGGVVVLAAFAWLIRRFLLIARHARDGFGALVCVGCAAVIGYEVLVNIAMLLGLLPITGIALPFLSYGGSSLVLNYLMVGLVLNIASQPE